MGCIVMATTENNNAHTRRLTMQRNVSKDEWVDMFRAIGLTDEQMTQWHRLFEKRHPEAHADFMTWLGIASDEIDRIRAQHR